MLEVLARIRHRRTRRQLSPYLDGMLSVQESRRLQAHLAQCQACRDELAELQATVQSLAELPLVESPRSFALTAAPRRAEAPRPAPRRLEFGLGLATATVAFVLALVAVGDLAGVPGDDGQEGDANVVQEAALREVESLTTEAEDKAASEAPTAPSPDVVGPETGSPPAGMGPGEEATPFLGAPAPLPSAPPELAPGMAQPATPAATATVAATAAPAATAPPSETPPLAETPVPAETPAPMEAPPSAFAETPEAGSPAPTEGSAEATATPADVAAEIAPSETQEQPLFEADVAAEEAARDSLAAEDGGPSKETVLRWLEIGLAAGLALLFVSWVLARRKGQA